MVDRISKIHFKIKKNVVNDKNHNGLRSPNVTKNPKHLLDVV